MFAAVLSWLGNLLGGRSQRPQSMPIEPGFRLRIPARRSPPIWRRAKWRWSSASANWQQNC